MLEFKQIIHASCIVEGAGAGPLLRLTEPVSFWGGVDAQTGMIVQSDHPQYGVCLAARVMVMEKAKGSSSSSSVLAELIRSGKGPAAIVMRKADLIVALGAIVADELYGIQVPIAALDEASWNTVFTATSMANATVECRAKSATFILREEV